MDQGFENVWWDTRGREDGKERRQISIWRSRAFYGASRGTKRSGKDKEETDEIMLDRAANLIHVKESHPICRDFHHRLQFGFQLENRSVHVYGSDLKVSSIFTAVQVFFARSCAKCLRRSARLSIFV